MPYYEDQLSTQEAKYPPKQSGILLTNWSTTYSALGGVARPLLRHLPGSSTSLSEVRPIAGVLAMTLSQIHKPGMIGLAARGPVILFLTSIIVNARALPSVGCEDAPVIQQWQREQEAIRALKRVGGQVRTRRILPSEQSLQDEAMQKYFERVVAVEFRSTYAKAKDSDLVVLRNFERLEVLTLSGTPALTTEALQYVPSPERLTGLHLRQGTFTDTNLVRLRDFPNLHALTLTGKEITDEGLSHIRFLPHLRRLDLMYTSVSDRVLDKLHKVAPGLVDLSVWGGTLTDSSLQDIGRFGKLELLNLCDSRFSEWCLTDISKATRLKQLTVGFPISDNQAPLLGRLQQLRCLWLLGGISDRGLGHVAKLPHLEGLVVRGRRMTDTGLHSLSQCATLKSMWLQGTGVTPAAVKRLSASRPDLKVTGVYEQNAPMIP